MLVLKTQGAVGKVPVAVVKIGVDRTGIDDCFSFNLVADSEEIGIELKANIGVVEHPLEQGGVAVSGHDLELIIEVAVITVGSNRDASGDGSTELGGVETPLFTSVTTKEFFVEVAPDDVEDDVFAGFNGIAGFAHLVEEDLNTGFIKIKAIKAVNGVLVDGNREQLTVDTSEDAMLVGHPVSKAREVIDHTLGVGVKNMGAVAVDEDAVGVGFVVGVAADVGTLVND